MSAPIRPENPRWSALHATDVNIDVIEEPDGRYRLTARIAGVTYLTDRFGIRGTGLQIDYSELLAHAAAVVMAARPTADVAAFDFETRTRSEQLHQARQEHPDQPVWELPAWMQEEAVVRITGDSDHGWIKGFLGSVGAPPQVMVWRQEGGFGLHAPDALTHVPDPPAEILAWIEAEKAKLQEEDWQHLRQQASGVRVYRLEDEMDLLTATLVPRADLTAPQVVEIDLLTVPTGRDDYRDDLSAEHRLTLETPDGTVLSTTVQQANQIHARATALLLNAYPDPETPLPGWRLRTDEDRLLGENQMVDVPEPAVGQVVRTPQTGSQEPDFGRVDHLRLPGLVAVARVDQGTALFPVQELEPYRPSAEEQLRLDAVDREIREGVRARAERESGSARLRSRGPVPDLY